MNAILQLRELYTGLPRNLQASFAIYFVLGFLNVTSFKLYLPLLRSLVVCDDLPGTGANAAYSGSPYCGDQNVVIAVALQQEAWLVGIKLVLRMFSGPILGVLCDRHGRKPILMVSIAGITLAFLLMFIACVQSLIPAMPILTLALAIQGATTAFNICFKAIIVDTLPAEKRAQGFVVMGQVDVLSRGITISFVIFIQKIQFAHYEWLSLVAFILGLGVLLACHKFLDESLPSKLVKHNGSNGTENGTKNGTSSAVTETASLGIWELVQSRLSDLSPPLRLLKKSRFLQLRLLQVFLVQFGDGPGRGIGGGWECVQDSFMISVLGWTPGDWELANVPISSLREVWGTLTSGRMVEWAKDPARNYFYAKANMAFTMAMLLVQGFGPFGAGFMLLPRVLLSLVPGDGGADPTLFSSQFSSDVQGTASGLLTAADNLASGLGRLLYANLLFEPSARGWVATYPLWIRLFFTFLGNCVCLFIWRQYGIQKRKDD